MCESKTVTATFNSLNCGQVHEAIDMKTNDLEFATLQAIAVTGFNVIKQSRHFTWLGDVNNRMVIGYE